MVCFEVKRSGVMIGRVAEVEELNRLFDSDESEFVAVYGRRRVGKTYLVRETFGERFTFQHTGLPNATMQRQISHFFKSLKEQGCTEKRCPKDWFEAFDMLRGIIASCSEPRKVVFIDELPWMDTPRSEFLSALESFWNEWASARKDVLFVICGSASSWIVKRLFRNRGGLHNRVTARIRLQPFTLGECERYVQERGLAMTRKDIAECYMAMGGVPYYWRHLVKGLSVAQNFNRIFFADGAPLRGEFAELYSSLFRNAAHHVKVVSALAGKKMGMSRAEIADATGLEESGQLTDTLETLEESGFIRRYRAFGMKRRNSLYQLIDNFTLFHFKFLDGVTTDSRFWTATVSSPLQTAWRGLAFEQLCLLHLDQMRDALKIGGVRTEAFAWRHVGDEVHPDGAQIDLLLDRADNVINVCEMKYAQGLYAIEAKTAEGLAQKMETFRSVTKTRKALHLTMVTSNGLVHNAYWGSVQAEVTLDDLFA